MSWSLEGYAKLLDAASAAGYRFAHFDRAPQSGDVLPAARRRPVTRGSGAVAELEAAQGASATYFLMTRSVFYNLASAEGESALAHLRDLGHRVGLHAFHPHIDIDARFDRVLAWHNPDPEFMTAPVDGLVNVDVPAVVRPGALPLGLEPALAARRSDGCADRARVRLAPAPDAPRDLGVRGRDDARVDGGDAGRTARGRVEQLAEDRIDLS